MVWLIAGIPAVTLVAAVILIVIMSRSGMDETAGQAQDAQEHEIASGMPPP